MAVLRWRVAAGILSAGLTLGVAELLAAFIRPESAPIHVLGSTVVDHTPDGLREWAISTFGTADKTVLFVCMGVVAACVAGLAGALERVDRATGSTLLVFFGLLAAFVAAGRYGFLAAVPIVIGVAAGVYALRVLTERIAEAFPGAAPEQPPPDAPPSGRMTPATASAPGDTGSRAAPETSGSQAQPDAAATHTATPAPTTGAAGEPRTGIAATAGSPGSAAEPRTEADAGTGSARSGPITTGPPRRELLRDMAITGGLALLAGVGGRLWSARRGDVSGERAAVLLPQPSEPAISLLPDADLRVPGLTPYITPNDDFYRIDTALFLPQVSIEDWSLRIHGMVDREILIGWGDLARRPVVERLVTLACVSNPVNGDLVGNALWRGYRLDELLAEAGPHPDADMVLSRSKDGWTSGTPLAALTDGRDALLAVGMNGEPLPVAHGYPARLVVPGLYGYVSATKWVTELEVTRFDRATAYWTRRGWSALGPIKTGTRIDTPRGRARRPAGRIPIAGVAWAQHRGITAVEVQIDDGDWRPARLSTEQSIDTWRQWVYDWDATPGTHTIRARSTDGTGEVQTAERRDVIPDGATGHPTLTIQIG
ncbi:molybdopterin-dependent oxidoreductase [Nocardia xishanensis]|uniref:molybdopterin-dependent oxidoreductase n=1 Tax=Nocardia xishanensis TaxID=238964 RepID=UPI0008378D08|nr:molybdopterin-dependent oxidoreductase [Nocardia xishanensis]